MIRHSSRVRWMLALVAATALVAAACGDDDDDAATDDTAANDTSATEPDDAAANTGDGELKIGYILPSSGGLGFLGPPMINAVEMAVDEINAAGGVLGQDVVLVGQDSGTDVDVSSTAADQLFAEGVDYIVGPAGSSIALGVLDKITGAGIPMCSPSNTGVQFSTIDDNGGYYFRTAPPDNLQAQVLADLIVNDEHQNVVVLGQSSEYGEGFASFLTEELESLGATVADTIIYDPDAAGFQAEAQQIAAAEPDAVAIISYDEGGQVMAAAIAEGVGPQEAQWYGADGIQGSTFYENIDADDPAIVEGIRGTAPSAAPADAEATFRDRFAEFAPDVDTIFSGHAFDCTVLAAFAAAAADSDAPADLQAEVNAMTRDGEQCTLVADCLDLLADGTDIDYDGAAGPLDFVEAGEPGAGAYDTWTFEADGSVTVLEESIRVGGGT